MESVKLTFINTPMNIPNNHEPPLRLIPMIMMTVGSDFLPTTPFMIITLALAPALALTHAHAQIQTPQMNHPLKLRPHIHPKRPLRQPLLHFPTSTTITQP